MDSTTIRYRLNLPHALHPVSPALSALHASRVTALHPEISAVLSPSHCPKCGTYYFSGDHPSYLVSTRKKRRRATSTHPKTLQRICHLCGFSIDARATASLDQPSVPAPSEASRTGTVPAIQRTKDISQEPPPPVLETVRTTKCAPVPPLPGQQSYPKPGHTKTSTLKNMLSRERQREEVIKSHKKRKEGHEGLVAFLKEL